jgi:hypothetical protein
MAIEAFDYQGFAQELASQASDLLPADFQDFQKNYVINTIKNFSTLSGEAIYNDENLGFNSEQGMLITQIIAEWSFHKSVDIIKAGILPEYWDGIMQKIAFTIFEIAKQSIIKGLSQDEILQIVEHHVKKSYKAVLEELFEKKNINKTVFDKAINQSNIDDMMDQLQKEKNDLNVEVSNQDNPSNSNSKILKLASVALLLKQMSQNKVQIILNKFEPQDAQTVVQYMQMPDLENKVDKDIAIKCLHEIKINLPEAKNISFDKILFRMNKIFEKVSREKIEKFLFKERPKVKEFINKAYNSEGSDMPSKVANIIVQHLEENVL